MGYSKWICLEEHHECGGLGSEIIEWIWKHGLNNKVNVQKIGVSDHFIHKLGDQDYVRKAEEIDSNAISNIITQML